MLSLIFTKITFKKPEIVQIKVIQRNRYLFQLRPPDDSEFFASLSDVLLVLIVKCCRYICFQFHFHFRSRPALTSPCTWCKPPNWVWGYEERYNGGLTLPSVMTTPNIMMWTRYIFGGQSKSMVVEWVHHLDQAEIYLIWEKNKGCLVRGDAWVCWKAIASVSLVLHSHWWKFVLSTFVWENSVTPMSF